MNKNKYLISYGLRRKLLIIAGASVLTAPLCAFAQQTKIPRIGYLTNLSERGVREEAFLKGMRDLGYVKGRNFVIEWRFAKGSLDRLPELAAELVRIKVDILATAGISAAMAAKRATSSSPIVMMNASEDPVRHGLIASLARPGGNITGLVDISPELAGKRLDLLKQLAPKTSRVAIIWDPTSPAATAQAKEAELAAPSLACSFNRWKCAAPMILTLPTRLPSKVARTHSSCVHTGCSTATRSES